MTCPRLNAPIVLAHGLFGFARIGLGPITLMPYFRGIPEFLRAAGNRVLVTRVHPTAGIARRGRKLGERIDAAFGGEPVHLIGHSLGGLDARVLAADPAWAGRVLSLTTVATPHLGTTLADVAQRRLAGVYRLLEAVGLDHRGFLDITLDSARDWHDRLPAPAGVACFSIAGDPPSEDVCDPLRRLHAALLRWEGPNDGLVSVASSIAFGTPLDPWPADHFRQMGWYEPSRPALPFPRVCASYAAIVGHLAGLGFADEAPSEHARSA